MSCQKKCPATSSQLVKVLPYLIKDHSGQILISRRPPKGLLGGMDGLPTSDWTTIRPKSRADSWPLGISLTHTFTHFHLRLHLYAAPENAAIDFPEARFVADLEGLALPTLFKKALDKMIEKGNKDIDLS